MTDPAKIPLWFDTFKKCQYVGEQRSGVGTRYYVEEKVPGPLRKVHFEAVAWDENTALRLRMKSGENVSSYEIHWKLKAHDTGTAFHFVEDVGMPFGILGRLLGVLGRRTAEKMVEAMLRRLKTLCETPGWVSGNLQPFDMDPGSLTRGDDLLKNTGLCIARYRVRPLSVIPGLTRNPCYRNERAENLPEISKITFTGRCPPPRAGDRRPCGSEGS